MSKQVTRTCHLIGGWAIPVGHRVQLSFGYRKDRSGDQVVDQRQPLIQDLDSGVWYGTEHHFPYDMSVDAAAYLPEPRDFEAAEILVGRVVHCQIVRAVRFSKGELYTTLVIDPEASS